MRDAWQLVKLNEVCNIINGRNQKLVESPDGEYPIYGSGGIMGYATDYLCEAGATIIGRKGSINNPIYVETRFWNVDTAFGLLPKPCMNSRLFHYFCLSFDFTKMNKGTTIPSLVKNDLLQIDVPYNPSISEQQRIVGILDAEFEKIDALKANAEKNLQNAKDLFQAALKKELEPKDGWTQETMYSLSDGMFAGGDAPKDNMSNTPSNDYSIPIIANAVENDGLYGYTNEARVTVPAITIAGRGSGTGFVMRRLYPFFPIVRLIVIIPNTNKVCLDFLYYAIKSLNIRPSGAAIPQLTIPMIKDYLISYPTVKYQTTIANKLSLIENRCISLQKDYLKTIALCNDLKQALLRKAFSGEL